MSAALKVPNGPPTVQSPIGTKTLEDGSVLISVEELARFGGGDPSLGRKELRHLLAMETDGPVYNGPTKKPESVRIAGPQDEDACVALWINDLRANADHIAPIDEEKVRFHVEAATQRRGSIIGVIDGPEGNPVAMVVLAPRQWDWSQGWFLQEMCNYVHPDHRRSRHVDDLLDFSKWASDDMSRGFGYRVYMLCGVLGAWRVRAKVALYRRRFQQVGSVNIYPAVPIKGN